MPAGTVTRGSARSGDHTVILIIVITGIHTFSCTYPSQFTACFHLHSLRFFSPPSYDVAIITPTCQMGKLSFREISQLSQWLSCGLNQECTFPTAPLHYSSRNHSIPKLVPIRSVY